MGQLCLHILFVVNVSGVGGGTAAGCAGLSVGTAQYHADWIDGMDTCNFCNFWYCFLPSRMNWPDNMCKICAALNGY